MSIVKIFGKDKVIFATKEDHATPSNVELPPPEPAPGLITKEGEINWSCPCLGGMATGPCGVEFRNAFSCFHYSEAEPKGSDCYEAFRTMQDCFTQYPTVYNKAGGNDDDDDDGEAGGLGGLATMSAAGGGGSGDNSETAADSDKQSAVAAADATAVNVKQ